MQLTAAVSFLTILQEESVSIHTYAHSFLQVILLHLEHRDAGQGSGVLNYILIYCFLNVVVMFFEPLFSLMSITEWGHDVQELIISLTKNSHGCILQNLKNSVSMKAEDPLVHLMIYTFFDFLTFTFVL